MHRRAFITTSLGLGILGAGGLPQAACGMGLSEGLLARELADLRFSLVNALNTRDASAFAGTYAEDGVWEVAGGTASVGRDAIRARLEGVFKRYPWLLQTNHDAKVLSASATEARARVYFSEHGSVEGESRFVMGVYDERCVRRAGAWLYARRTATILYSGPPDLSAPMRRPIPPIPGA